MKVIESGNPNGLWNMEIRCTGEGNGDNGCGAILEINGNDPFHTHSSFCGRFSKDYITIECVECKTWTDLSDSEKEKVPYGILTKIDNMVVSSPGKPITRNPKS